ncbi:MAG TPA: polysaccharide biosynthesis C-terminal domain-containing protein [Candidatus Omnitrophota bacterium]|nr:polysaccharide biosynthesis C-terminal domain-containing protein [Candidatus Omnitrophota bacterium]
MTKSRLLVAGSLLGIINFFATTLVSLFMMPFLIRILGDRMYGLWLLFGSYFGFYGLLDLGLGTAVQRYVSRAIGQDDYEEANRVFNSSLIVFSLIGLVAIVLSLGIAILGPLWFKDPFELRLFRIIIMMTGFGLALSFPMRSFWALFSSHLRYDLSIYIDLAKLAVRTALIVFFLSRGGGLLTFAVIMFLTDVAVYGVNAFVSLKVAPYIRFRKHYIQFSQIRHLFGYSIYSFILQVSGNIKFNIDNFVIAGFVGLSSVTLYSVASRLIGYYMQFLNNAVGIVTPVFSQYEGQNNYEAIREKLFFMTKISGYIACLIGSLLVIFGRAFIERWVGSEYSSAYNIIMVLLAPILLSLIQAPSTQVLYGISKHKFLAIAGLVEALCNLTLSLIFVRYYGVIGVALGTAIPLFIFTVFIKPVYLSRVLKISLWDYIRENLRILIVSFAVVFSMLLVLNRFLVAEYLRIVILGTVYSLIFCLIVFILGFSKEEHKYLIGIGKKILKLS